MVVKLRVLMTIEKKKLLMFLFLMFVYGAIICLSSFISVSSHTQTAHPHHAVVCERVCVCVCLERGKRERYSHFLHAIHTLFSGKSHAKLSKKGFLNFAHLTHSLPRLTFSHSPSLSFISIFSTSFFSLFLIVSPFSFQNLILSFLLYRSLSCLLFSICILFNTLSFTLILSHFSFILSFFLSFFSLFLFISHSTHYFLILSLSLTSLFSLAEKSDSKPSSPPVQSIMQLSFFSLSLSRTLPKAFLSSKRKSSSKRRKEGRHPIQLKSGKETDKSSI